MVKCFARTSEVDELNFKFMQVRFSFKLCPHQKTSCCKSLEYRATVQAMGIAYGRKELSGDLSILSSPSQSMEARF